MFDVVYPNLEEMRQILDKENLADTARFNDLEWRLSLVTGTRLRQKMVLPKYTVKLDLQAATKAVGTQEVQTRSDEKSDPQIESILFDSDYTNMKRLQESMEEALKSLNGRYPRKVMKFIQ